MPHTKEGEHACQIHGKLIEIRDGKYSPAYKNIQYHINMGKNMRCNGFVVQNRQQQIFLQNLK